MVGVPKIHAAGMLLRGMNPQIIAMDEITQETDLAAAEEVGGCGVTLFATAHGRDLADLKHRVLYKKLMDSGIFRELVIIHANGGKRQYTREALP
jgi:stage III sporulation protein AA